MAFKTTTFWLLLALIGLLTLAVYWPGTHGSFLFDDFATLPALGKFGPVDNWLTFWRYITSGGGDPTGRPIAMLSFLMDAHNWPADPWPFKRSNLILHVINGILLILLLRKLGGMVFRANLRTDLAALLAGSYWMLQPLFVSTTLYIVQRETMLCASLVLTGLLSWLHGRRLLLDGRRSAGLAWIVFGLGICTALAALSKANGILLPALALAVEYGFLRAYMPKQAKHNSIYRLAMTLLALLPTVGLIVYLSYEGWRGFIYGVPPSRSWTLAQRLLTEPRVLISYLKLLWLPRPFTTGLFNDQISASTSLWAPTSTLPALLAILGLIFYGWRCRHHRPAVALAIGFYFMGQLLESTTIPLELYFEHRNYIPAMMIYWPLGLWLCSIPTLVPLPGAFPFSRERSLTAQSPLARVGKPILALVLVFLFAAMTRAAATLWGDSQNQAELWATLNPLSPRAQTNAAIQEMHSGRPDRAAARLAAALANAPNEPQLALNLLNAECSLGHVNDSSLRAARESLRIMRDNGPLLLHWFEDQLVQIQHSPCTELNLGTLQGLLDAALANQHLMAIYGRRQDLYHLQGRLDLAQGKAWLALQFFDKALDQEVTPQAALSQAALLGITGFPLQGLAHLDYYQHEPHLPAKPDFGMQRIHAWLLEREQYWPNELARLRAALAADASFRTKVPDVPE